MNMRIVLAITLCAGLVGCDQMREKLANALHPKTSQEALALANQKLSSGEYQKAIDEAQPFVKEPSEQQQPLALVTARAYGSLGNAEQARVFLTLAAQAGALDRTALMTDASFSSIMTDIRFVSFVAALASAEPAKQQPAPTAQPATAGGTSVQLGNGGVSATAGSVSVRLP